MPSFAPSRRCIHRPSLCSCPTAQTQKSWHSCIWLTTPFKGTENAELDLPALSGIFQPRMKPSQLPLSIKSDRLPHPNAEIQLPPWAESIEDRGRALVVDQIWMAPSCPPEANVSGDIAVTVSTAAVCFWNTTCVSSWVCECAEMRLMVDSGGESTNSADGKI